MGYKNWGVSMEQKWEATIVLHVVASEAKPWNYRDLAFELASMIPPDVATIQSIKLEPIGD